VLRIRHWQGDRIQIHEGAKDRRVGGDRGPKKETAKRDAVVIPLLGDWLEKHVPPERKLVTRTGGDGRGHSRGWGGRDDTGEPPRGPRRPGLRSVADGSGVRPGGVGRRGRSRARMPEVGSRMKPRQRCPNDNHGRAVVTVHFCAHCGEVVNGKIPIRTCSKEQHAKRRRARNAYCTDCGSGLFQAR